MNDQSDIIQIPLSQLRLSPRNARKTGSRDIEGLAASIVAHKLLQNLTVTPGDTENDYQVVAGGRRLAALQLLRDRGQLQADFGVPCKVISDNDEALEASTAENTLREAMHPADQFDAFKGMVDASKSIPDVAAHFGVSELVVRQRLKLANVSPKLIQVYRDGGMDLDQLQALALTDDRKLQETIWYGTKESWQRRPHTIRQAITQSEVRGDSVVAKYVGIEAYEAAGGSVRRDLFSSRDEVFLGDRALLDKLALDKLEAMAQSERDGGWSWAEAHVGMDFEKIATYPRTDVLPKTQKPTAEDKTRIAALQARIDEIDKLIEEDDENDTLEIEQREILAEEAEDLGYQLRTLSNGREVWPADVMAKAGVLVCITSEGLRIYRGRLKPGQRVTANGEVAGTATTAKDKPQSKATLSQDMVLRLEMHRAAALRDHIAANPKHAINLLLTQMLTKLFTESHAESVLDLAVGNQHRKARGLIESKFPDLDKSAARRSLEDRLTRWKKAGMPSKASEIHAWLDKMNDAAKLELLALATAFALDTNPGVRGNAMVEGFGIDMAQWWSATPDTFIGIVPKSLLAEAVAEVAGKAAGEALLLLKKDAAMADAAKQLAGTGWLPKPLRGPVYAVGKPASSKAAAAAPPKAGKPSPTPAKKVAKKAPKKAAKKVAKHGSKTPAAKKARTGAKAKSP
jgi:ParB family transcriptional regulator, chromosome partitioning protein